MSNIRTEANSTRGVVEQFQIAQLLLPVENFRVVTGQHVQPHLSQQDVLAHLNRVFGFGNFDVEVLETVLLFEEEMVNKSNNAAWRVGYRAVVRLTIRNQYGQTVAHYDGGSTGESEGQPSRAGSHDLAFKSALSTATKRAAIHLGDQFGLSLYNKGQREAIVMGTLIDERRPKSGEQSDVQAGVTQQHQDGGTTAERWDADEAAEAAEGSQEAPQPTALPKAEKRATNGRQGTRRTKPAAPKAEPSQEAAQESEQAPAAAEAPQAASEAPVTAPTAVEESAPQPETPEQAERREREEMAAEQTRLATEREQLIATADQVDRSDEVAVAQWNTTHGKATGHFITSDAERETQAAKIQEQAAQNDPEPFVDTVTGDVYQTADELDAAIRARVQKNQAERAEEASAPAAPSAFEVARSEEPDNYERMFAAATTSNELRTIWEAASATMNLTEELSAKIIARKEEIEAAG